MNLLKLPAYIRGFKEYFNQKLAPRIFRLYYYTKAEHLESILRTGNLKVTQLGHSNDPFEYRPVFKDAEEESKWELLMPTMAPCTVCLSARMSSPVMWGHYAEHGAGICLVFDLPLCTIREDLKQQYANDDNYKVYLCQSREGKTFFLHEVVYTDERLRLNKVRDYLQSQTKRVSNFFKFFATKSTDWSYEKEFRVQVHEDDLHAEKGLLFTNILKEYLTGIILGHQCTYSYTYVKTLLKETNNEAIRVSKAKLSPTHYKISAMSMDFVLFEDSSIEDLHAFYYKKGITWEGSLIKLKYDLWCQYLQENKL